MKSARIFLLDDNEGARAAELFDRVAPEKRDTRMLAIAIVFLLTAIVTTIVGVAYAEDGTWKGQSDEQGQPLSFALRYDGDKPLVHIAGPKYDCLLTGKPPALAGSTATAKAYPVTSNGGRCDQLLAGRLELDEQSPQDLLLRTVTSRGEKLHELHLRQSD
jgi:hypothetical protein